MRTSDIIEEYLQEQEGFVLASKVRKDLKLSHGNIIKGIRQLTVRKLLDIEYHNTKKFLKLKSEVKTNE